MKNNEDQDAEEDRPIISSNEGTKNPSNIYNKKRILTPKCINLKKAILFISSIIFLIYLKIFLITYKLNKKIEKIDKKIDNLNEISEKKKIGVAFIQPALYANGIGRIITLLTELLAKTGLYDVYLINEKTTPNDFKVYEDVKRVIQIKNKFEIKRFDKKNNIQFYVLNNDLTENIETYKSLGKKVIGIFHGVFLSCIFTNHTSIYSSWNRFGLYDSFVQIIADDYWVYKKFNFQNVVYIPNLYTFEHTLTPNSNLTGNNVLIVGRIDDVIKGTQFGVKAMKEVIKEIPDSKLYIVSEYHDPKIKKLVKDLNIQNNVKFMPYSHNISEYYLKASVLIVASLSESFPMVMNEGKAHGLPIVAHNIEYSPCFQEGVITVDMFDYKAMGKEIIKLLKDYNYRKKKGKEAKLSLDMYKNSETIETWGRLFRSLLRGENAYHEFQQKIEHKYYNEKVAMERIKRHYHYAQQFNKHFKCHSFENFTDLNYLKKIKVCQI